MANLVYIFNCGVNPIMTMSANNQPVTLPSGGLPPWPSGVALSTPALSPVSIPLLPAGSGTPANAALVAGYNNNTIAMNSQQINYNGALDLTSFTLQAADNMAMFIFFAPGGKFFGQPQITGPTSQVILTDSFETITQSYFLSSTHPSERRK